MPDLEYIFLTIHYDCGCSALRPTRRDAYEQDYPMHALEDSRDITEPGNCAIHKALVLRAYERKMERRGVAG